MSGQRSILADCYATITVDGRDYHGVFLEQWDNGLEEYVMTFNALSDEGVAVWGSRVP